MSITLIVYHTNRTHFFYPNAIRHYNGLGGYLHYIYWTDDNDNPICVDYLAIMEDEAKLIYQTDVVQNVGDIDSEDVNKPIIVDDTNRLKGFTLEAKIYPTGENRYYYELSLRNQNGQIYSLKHPVYLFIPYPSFLDRSRLDFTIRHYSPDGSTVIEYMTEADIQRTTFVLRIRVSSLSPFTLSWEESDEIHEEPTPPPTSAPTSAVPSTGDAFPLEWLALCLVLSSCVIFIINSKRKKTR